MALDVRDKELQLFETNKQLRDLSPEQLNDPDTRRRIETQADAERSNGRRLTNLVASGEDLVEENLGLVLVGMFVSVFTGLISGFAPAWSASRLDPVTALRYE